MRAQKAIVYARVSTTRQAENDLSIPDQLAHAQRYCQSKNIEIIGEYIDAGVSGRTEKRPQFQNMIRDVKSGTITVDLVLVHSLSRFFRDHFGSEFYRRELAKYDVSLISMTQDMGDGPQAKMANQFMSIFDEYQSNETSKHVSRSMLENARRGFWNGSKPPYGYKTYVCERVGAKEKKKLELEPKEAEVVKLIFQLYLYGDGKTGPLGINLLTAYLNERNYKHRNIVFRAQTVHGLLKRTAYIGLHHFNKRDSRTQKFRPREEWIEIPIPALVDEQMFYAVQEQLKSRNPRVTPPRIASSSVLLTGIAKCGECGAPMRLRTGKSGKYRYYTCSAKVDKGATACSGHSIPMAKLDELVTDAICDKVLTPNRLDEIVGKLFERNSGRKAGLQQDLQALHQRKREVAKQVQNLLDLMEDGGVGIGGAMRARFNKRQEEQDELIRLIALKQREIDSPLTALDPAKTEKFAKALKARLQSDGNPKFRRAYLRTMLSDVIVSDEEIQISGPKAALAHVLSSDTALAPSMVPIFMEGWCTRRDSNARPLPSEGSALSS